VVSSDAKSRHAVSRDEKCHRPRDGKVPLDIFRAELSAIGRADVVTIPSGSAVRHRYVEPSMSKLDYFLPVPGRTGLLTLAFATPVEPPAEPVAPLFDAIAESLRWRA
jgi:hypothetical protein